MATWAKKDPGKSYKQLPEMASGNGGEKPLRRMAEAFNGLSSSLNSHSTLDEASLDVDSFSHACYFVSPLLRFLGIAFKFAEMDYVAKVNDLAEASKTITTIPVMMEKDMEANCVRKAGSHSRNLLRVKRGLDMYCLSLLSSAQYLRNQMAERLVHDAVINAQCERRVNLMYCNYMIKSY